MIPRTWQHILGLGFQHAAKYHIDARRTCFATRIQPAKKSMPWLQLMSLPLKAIIIVSKFASGGRWKPTWIPRYLIPWPVGIHLRPSPPPHSQVLSFLLAQMAADLRQFTFTPDAWQKVLRTTCTLSMLAGEPYRYRAVSSANIWSLIKPPLGRERPSTPYLGSAIM